MCPTMVLVMCMQMPRYGIVNRGVVNACCCCSVLCMQMLHVLLTRAVAVRCCMVLCMQTLRVLLTRAVAVRCCMVLCMQMLRVLLTVVPKCNALRTKTFM